MLRASIRAVLRIPPPAISHALKIALEEGRRRGWHAWDRRRVSEGLRAYTVTVGEISPFASWWWMRVAADDGRIIKAAIAHPWRNPPTDRPLNGRSQGRT